MKKVAMLAVGLSCLASSAYAEIVIRDRQVNHAVLTGRRDTIMSREHFRAERRDAILAHEDMARGDVRGAIREEHLAQRNLAVAQHDAHAAGAANVLAQREIRRDIRRAYR